MDNQLLNHLHLGIFSRAEQRVLQAIFKAIADGGGQCVATVAALARDSGTSKRTVGNTVAQAVRLGIIEKQETDQRRISRLVRCTTPGIGGERFAVPMEKADWPGRHRNA
jgi:hypothetical protein